MPNHLQLHDRWRQLKKAHDARTLENRRTFASESCTPMGLQGLDRSILLNFDAKPGAIRGLIAGIGSAVLSEWLIARRIRAEHGEN